ncbi:CAAX amino terminal protease family protein [Candidatus Syntrophocurvum alkaliphilum]|uniref:CAAX amino terminal protease family protein n=1 Tax=Candidatus Syntrophocurvum alkaliphilum TaxID=2293317 RepID=A0A6I6DFS3_9FIRM|nr:type II CAAX endopeptidase family protein [Candidatus Syntrophocurvum alkaliphilum]QGU00866.1 CAAX amino terminal protease family protein [Candidatus Syntrophocurvum alkaliphilum]
MRINLKWGFKEIIFIYLGIIFFSLLFGFYGHNVYYFFLNIFNLADTDINFFITAFLFQFFVTILLIFTVAYRNRITLKDLGFKKASFNFYVKYGIIGGILLMIGITLMGIPLQYLKPDIEPQFVEEMIRSATTIQSFGILLVVVAVLAPLSEELFYRGMIYPVFRNYIGPKWGAIIAGIVFGLAHFDLLRAIPLAVGGIVLCYIYEKTGSIIVCTIAHGMWNALMALVVYATIFI